MRFYFKSKYKSGDKRVKDKFLWTPKKPIFSDDTRWLERAAWIDVYSGGIWVPLEFIDTDRYKGITK